MIDLIDDPLRAVKIAMENRVAMKESLPKRLATYPCAIEESANLQFHQKLIEHNQTILEGPPPAMILQLPPFKSGLEPALESKEGEKPHSSNEVDPPLMVPDSKEELSGLPSNKSGTKSFFQPKTIPSL